MTIGRDLEHRLDSWMQEDASLPDDLAEVLAKLPETPQQRHRWSLTITDTIRRTRSMFSATGVAAATAIFMLGASFALVAQPTGDPEEQATAPAAEASGPDDIARFTWRSSVSADYPGGTAHATEFGESFRGGRIEYTVDASDPRLDGTLAITYNYDYYDSEEIDYPVVVLAGVQVLENENGAWQGTGEGIDFPGTTDYLGRSVLNGTGAYEGLTAVLYATGTDQGEGLVFPGVMPEYP